MSPSALSFARLLALVLALTSSVSAQSSSGTGGAPPAVTSPPAVQDAPPPNQQFPATPHFSKHFKYPEEIPYKSDTDDNLLRGPQAGYNKCNSSTQNQDSLCQTLFMNNIADFALWAPSKPHSTVGETEGEMVAWSTKKGWGTRLIPRGALQAVQWIRTPDYALVSGFIDQSKINLETNPLDYGGEMDNFGADLRANPIGNLVYSNAFSGNNNSYDQIIYWHNFMGGNAFCFKICDGSKPNAPHYCEHVFDRIGCAYNAPTDVKNGTFQYCLGDSQDFPGEYVQGGKTVTYQQPPESLGPITTMPYTARIPATSSCVTYQSTDLYSDLLTVTAPGDTGVPSPTAKPSGGSRASTGSSSSPSGSSSDATSLAVGGVATLLGVVFSAMFLA